MPNTVRSYCSVQQLHAAYAREKAVAIRYADQQGNLLDTTAAVATGAFRRSQVRTEYSNGLVVTVNGHPTETWKTPAGDLPPNGWAVEDPRAKRLVVHKRPDKTLEVIPVGDCKVIGVSFDGRAATALALDEEGKTLDPAETRLSRGLVYTTPLSRTRSKASK